jgi:hypothetical protein
MADKIKKELDQSAQDAHSRSIIDQCAKECDMPDYCSIGLLHCHSCGWTGEYPRSGCPACNKSFVE